MTNSGVKIQEAITNYSTEALLAQISYAVAVHDGGLIIESLNSVLDSL